MASQFLSEQRDGLGSGGKVLRGRSLLPRFSPYSRPSSSSALVTFPAPEALTGRSPIWLRGLIFGAGKLISSVLGSDGVVSSPSECFSDSPSDEYYYSSHMLRVTILSIYLHPNISYCDCWSVGIQEPMNFTISLKKSLLHHSMVGLEFIRKPFGKTVMTGGIIVPPHSFNLFEMTVRILSVFVESIEW